MSVQVNKRKIPIPSFAPPVTPNKSTEAKDDASETKGIKIAVDVQRMIRLENALQLHLYQQKQRGTTSHSTTGAISFADFSEISSRVEPSSPTRKDDSAESNVKRDPGIPSAEAPPALVNLSRAERIWHDLYCVAVPTLYHLTVPKEEVKDGVPRPKKRRRLAAMALELKPTVNAKSESKNRLGELRRLIRESNEKGIPPSKSEKGLSLLLALKQEKENQSDFTVTANKGNSHKRTNESSIVDSLLRDTTSAATKNANLATIDDRIRARARERERNLEQAKAARKDPREERVAVADALYSYASHVLRRKQSRSRFTSNKKQVLNKTAASKCVVTFQEVVQKGLPNLSRKEITRIMLDIVKVLSNAESIATNKFLKWKDLRTNKTYGIPISKNAAVTIDTSDFKKVREILNRERISE